MEPRSLTFVAEACGGRFVRGRPDALVRRVSTDSRTVQPGDLFVAIAGERFDGHAFLNDAAAKGAAGLLVEAAKLPAQELAATVVAVDDTRSALGRLAARYRRDFKLPVIAVGGSNGKTTTKDLIASALGRRFVTLKSEASFNNDIGVPLTLLKLEGRHEAAVLEAGTNHPGELEPLLRMIAPRYGVVTSIGREHLEFFGDLAGVAAEEGMVAGLLPPDGKLLVNADSPEIERVERQACCRVVRLGAGKDCDWRAADVRVTPAGTEFCVTSERREFEGPYRVAMAGRHHAVNALFAIALGAELGLSRDEIASGLRECPPPAMRSRLEQFNGVWVLNDAYNANADSVAAALQTLAELPCRGRRIAVLGDMAELGVHTRAAQEESGRRAAEAGVDLLLAVGANAAVTGGAARAGGLRHVEEFASAETAASVLKQLARPGDVVLVKASRAARLERIVNALSGT